MLADPDSDAARRAFGTWMKTHPFPEGDDERGELVEVQLALAEVHRRHGRLQEWSRLCTSAPRSCSPRVVICGASPSSR